MTALEDRAGAAAEARAAKLRAAVADAARAVPGVSAAIEEDAVVIEGRDLLTRWVEDARLRYVGRAAS